MSDISDIYLLCVYSIYYILCIILVIPPKKKLGHTRKAWGTFPWWRMISAFRLHLLHFRCCFNQRCAPLPSMTTFKGHFTNTGANFFIGNLLNLGDVTWQLRVLNNPVPFPWMNNFHQFPSISYKLHSASAEIVESSTCPNLRVFSDRETDSTPVSALSTNRCLKSWKQNRASHVFWFALDHSCTIFWQLCCDWLMMIWIVSFFGNMIDDLTPKFECKDCWWLFHAPENKFSKPQILRIDSAWIDSCLS